MSDIVERLREEGLGFGIGPALLCQQAAEEIFTLRTQLSAIRDEYEASVAGYESACDILTEECDALRIENDKLREALNPFAVVAEMTIGESEDDRDLFRPAHNGPRLIVADFRKARTAMGE